MSWLCSRLIIRQALTVMPLLDNIPMSRQCSMLSICSEFELLSVLQAIDSPVSVAKLAGNRHACVLRSSRSRCLYGITTTGVRSCLQLLSP
jgi:hypothetical protein